MNDYKYKAKRKVIINWIKENNINRLGISYRLDQDDAVNMIGYVLEEMKKERLIKIQGGKIDYIFFGGLPSTCRLIEKEFKGLVRTFIGGESAIETLLKMGVSEDRIPKDVSEGSKYDDFLLEFGKEVIDSEEYLKYTPVNRSNYREYGTYKDTIVKRIDANMKSNF